MILLNSSVFKIDEKKKNVIITLLIFQEEYKVAIWFRLIVFRSGERKEGR